MASYVLFIRGVDIWSAPGTEMWQKDADGVYGEIGEKWDWSTTGHLHYLVRELRHPAGGYWVPVSTNPPTYMKKWWVPVLGSLPTGASCVNACATEYRPVGTFIWIPASFFQNQRLRTGFRSNRVVCTESVPDTYPPKNPVKPGIGKDKKDAKQGKLIVEFPFPSPDLLSTSDSASPSSSPSTRSTSMDID